MFQGRVTVREQRHAAVIRGRQTGACRCANCSEHLGEPGARLPSVQRATVFSTRHGRARATDALVNAPSTCRARTDERLVAEAELGGTFQFLHSVMASRFIGSRRTQRVRRSNALISRCRRCLRTLRHTARCPMSVYIPAQPQRSLVTRECGALSVRGRTSGCPQGSLDEVAVRSRLRTGSIVVRRTRRERHCG